MPSRITLNANGGPGSCAWSKSRRSNRAPARSGWSRPPSASIRWTSASARERYRFRCRPASAWKAPEWSPRWVRVSGLAPGDRVAYATGPLGAYASARLYPPSAC